MDEYSTGLRSITDVVAVVDVNPVIEDEYERCVDKIK